MKTKSKNKMEIETEFPMSIEELAFEVIIKGEKVSDMFDILDREPGRANEAVKRMLSFEIKDKVSDVLVKEVSFDYNDSGNPAHAVSYFIVKLEGTEKDLKKLVGQDKLFYYEWDK